MYLVSESVRKNKSCQLFLALAVFFSQFWSERHIRGDADDYFICKDLSHGCEAEGVIGSQDWPGSPPL